jgi:hypothetical protein
LYVNGVVVASGVASAALALSTTNVTPVVVTAVSADGTSTTYYTLNFIRTGTVPVFSARTFAAGGIGSSITNYNPLNTYTFTTTAGAVVQGVPTATVLPITLEGLYVGQAATVSVSVSRPGFTTTTASFTATATTVVLLKPLFSNPIPTTTGFTVNVLNYYRPAGATTYTWSYAASIGYTAVAGTPVGSVVPVTVTGPALTGMQPILTVTTQRTGATCPAGCGSASVSTFTTASVGIRSLMKVAPAIATPAKVVTKASAKATKLKAAKLKAAKLKAAKLKAAKLKAIKPKK